ncbi:MAG: isoprenylcysteine carboxylmethyltransferase family protein [Anaerolineales bacterium]|nr:isoprenylcysteine carboxylmethyltransferase family protein [Anaerolineales bacterium]
MIKQLSKIALPILIIAILYLLITQNLLSASPFVIAAQLLAIALAVWARRTFQAGQFNIAAEPKDGPLMSNGPYQFIRHPMYTAALMLIWSGVLSHWSLITAGIGLIVTAEVFIRVIVEEEFLRARFLDYAAYARKTKRIIPFVL